MRYKGKNYTISEYRRELKKQTVLKKLRESHDFLIADEIRVVTVLEDINHMNVANVIPGFSKGKYELLHYLGEVYKDSPGEGIAFTDLATLSHIPFPHLSRGLKKLEEEKLVRRKHDPRDKRSTKIFFTPKGKELYDKTEKIMYDFYIDVFDNISTDKLRTLAPLLEQLDRQLNKEIKRRVSGNLQEDIARFMTSELSEENRDLSRDKAMKRIDDPAKAMKRIDDPAKAMKRIDDPAADRNTKRTEGKTGGDNR